MMATVTVQEPWGVRPGQTEQRMKAGYYTESEGYSSYFKDEDFSDPFTKKVKVVFSKFEPLFRGRGVFRNYGKLEKLLYHMAADCGLRGGSDATEFELLVANFGGLNSSVEAFIEELKLQSGRARNYSFKQDLDRAARWLASFWTSVVEAYGALTPTQVLVQRHFATQLRVVPRAHNIGNRGMKVFFGPLYLHRDAYFREPSEDNLARYLTCWELLLREDLYRERILGRDAEEAEAAVRALADEIEVMALWTRETTPEHHDH